MIKQALILDTIIELRKILVKYKEIYGDFNLENKNELFNVSFLKSKKSFNENRFVNNLNDEVALIEQPSVLLDSDSIKETLSDIEIEVVNSKQCSLAETRLNTVFGAGSSTAKLVVVGEAPGEREDIEGSPFVGAAGQLLTKMLKAIGIDRNDIFICNVLKCRPPLNRDPSQDEIKFCSRYLERQLSVIKPDVILALGRIATQWLLGVEAKMYELRQKVHRYKGFPVIVTYHPAALLRNEKWKRPAWEDLQFLERYLHNKA